MRQQRFAQAKPGLVHVGSLLQAGPKGLGGGLGIPHAGTDVAQVERMRGVVRIQHAHALQLRARVLPTRQLPQQVRTGCKQVNRGHTVCGPPGIQGGGAPGGLFGRFTTA